MYAPENTLAAFRLAVEQGADGIELDVKLSRDGEVVVFHDQMTQRITGETGRVNQLTLTELKRLSAGAFFADSFRKEKIPTLKEVFETVGDNVFLFIELTNYLSWSDGLVEKTAALVKEHHLEHRAVFISFLPWNISRLKKLLPNVPFGLLMLQGIAGNCARSNTFRRFSPNCILPKYLDVTPKLIHEEHNQGRQVITWTVNDRELMIKFMRMGINGLITNDPPTALQLREQL